MPTQEKDGSSPPVSHLPSLMTTKLSPRPITTNFTLTIPSTPSSAPPLAGDISPHCPPCPDPATTLEELNHIGDKATLAALHAYHQWEKEELFTVQEFACLNSQRAFQCIKLMEWKEALNTADAYDRITMEMKDHVPWGEREQTAIGQVIPYLRK